MAAAVRAAGGRVLADLPVVDGVSAVVPAAALRALADAADVHAVTADRVGRFVDFAWDEIPSASTFTRTVQATSSWTRGNYGRGVGVAVLDTGVSPMPDLADRLVHGPDLSGEGTVVDSYGHGTVMAGLIAGNGAASANRVGGAFPGVAPAAHVVSVKVAGRNGVVDVSTVLQAMHWISAYREQYGIRVLNLSWGVASTQSPTVDPVNHAVQRLWAEGVVVVVAAGNSGSNSGTITKPGDDPVVLTVGAYNDQGDLEPNNDGVPQWSSRGPTAAGVAKPDLVAPGRTVVSLRSPGSTIEQNNPKALLSPSYIRGSGTSQAAAVASGAAALLLAARPSLTPDQVKALLTSTAAPIPNLGRYTQGSGRLQLEAALSAPAPTAVQPDHRHRPRLDRRQPRRDARGRELRRRARRDPRRDRRPLPALGRPALDQLALDRRRLDRRRVEGRRVDRRRLEGRLLVRRRLGRRRLEGRHLDLRHLVRRQLVDRRHDGELALDRRRLEGRELVRRRLEGGRLDHRRVDRRGLRRVPDRVLGREPAGRQARQGRAVHRQAGGRPTVSSPLGTGTATGVAPTPRPTRRTPTSCPAPASWSPSSPPWACSARPCSPGASGQTATEPPSLGRWFLLVVTLTLLTDVTAIDLRVGRHAESHTWSELTVVLGLALLDVHHLVLTSVAVAVAYLVTGQPLVKWVFNVGSYAVGVFLAAKACQAVGTPDWDEPGRSAVALLVGATVWAVWNKVTTDTAISLAQVRPLHSVLGSELRSTVFVSLCNVGLAFGCLGLAQAGNTDLLWVAPVCVVLAATLNRGFLQLAQDREAWRALESASRELNALDEQVLVEVALTRVTALMQADGAELRLSSSAQEVVHRLPGRPVVPVRAPGTPTVTVARAQGRAGLPLEATEACVPLTAAGEDLGALVVTYAGDVRLNRRERSQLTAYAGALAVALCNARLHEQVRGQAERSAHAALHDALTGLPNRSLLRSHLDVARGERPEFAMLLLDLDLFKPVNDTHGHEAGDEVLRVTAARLRAAVRPVDVVARLGGDEFAVLVHDPADVRGTRRTARGRRLGADRARAGHRHGRGEHRPGRPRGRRLDVRGAAARRRRRHVPGQALAQRPRAGRRHDLGRPQPERAAPRRPCARGRSRLRHGGLTPDRRRTTVRR